MGTFGSSCRTVWGGPPGPDGPGVKAQSVDLKLLSSQWRGEVNGIELSVGAG
jgi:hypothetical protein